MQHTWLKHWLWQQFSTSFSTSGGHSLLCSPCTHTGGWPRMGRGGFLLLFRWKWGLNHSPRCLEELAALTSLWNKFGTCSSLQSCSFYSNKIIYTQSKDLQRFFSLPERIFYQPKTSLLIAWNYWLAGFPRALTVLLQLQFLVRERNNWHSTSFPYKCQHLCSSHLPSHPQNPELFTSF